MALPKMRTRHPNPGPGPVYTPATGWYEARPLPKLQPRAEEPPPEPKGKRKRGK